MLKLEIKTDGKDVLINAEEDKPTLQEIAIVLLHLKQYEQDLIDRQFECKFDITGDKDQEEDEAD